MNAILLSGTSNLPLAQNVAKLLGSDLGDIEITRFADGECRVYIKEEVKGKQVCVLQSLSSIADEHLVELCLMGQALKQMDAAHLTAIIPWMGYSKQDKEFRKGEAVSAQLVAKFIESAGFNAVITIELHSERLVPYFTIPVVELKTYSLLAGALGNSFDSKQTLVISPDLGGTSRSKQFADFLKLPIVYQQKKRDVVNGAVTISGLTQEVKNFDIILYDDIINSGATAIQTSEFLKSRGAGRVTVLATHAVLAKQAAANLESSSIDAIIVTDSIAIPQHKHISKLSVVSVAQSIADAINTQTR